MNRKNEELSLIFRFGDGKDRLSVKFDTDLTKKFLYEIIK